ncbi:uncharacterized protein LOC141627354 [Silene latifolia]|uniref:uncharacterized protein LOC141627354 n=1 Tax=Silene latifolia TaxID=37657 RepID=UPI003D77FDB0
MLTGLAYQAACLATTLGKLGVSQCSLVGFSYGGMVAFKLAEMRPDLVEALVVSGSILAMTESVSEAELSRMGFKSSAELQLPTSVDGLKTLLKVATHRKLWFPDCLHKDDLEECTNEGRIMPFTVLLACIFGDGRTGARLPLPREA